MKIIRSSKCSIKFATKKKQKELERILFEYSKVVNFFINYFWNKKIGKRDLTKKIFDLPASWITSRLKQVAAREALDMINSSKEVLASNKEQMLMNIKTIEVKIDKIKNKENNRANRRKINNLFCKAKRLSMKYNMMQPQKPKHKGKRMCVSSQVAILQSKKDSIKFDLWLHLYSIGNKISMDLPIVFHRHYRNLEKKGNRLNSYIITKSYVQFSFEIETGPKKTGKNIIGIDTGINALASTSEGKQFGKDIKKIINKIKNCKYGSKRQKRLKNFLKYRISEVAKEVINDKDLIVVEKLKNLNSNSKLKGRLSKNIRSSIGSWNYSYWLRRLQEKCEDNRVIFRTVPSYYTSQKCSKCGYTDSSNRNGELFECRKCYHTGNADILAASNILDRFVTGKYGSCYKTI